jgi:sphinganine-1-phosphate aldolase
MGISLELIILFSSCLVGIINFETAFIIILSYKILASAFPIFKKRYYENSFGYVGRLLLCFPIIDKMYKLKVDPFFEKSEKKMKTLMEKLPTIVEIPLNGWTNEQIINLIDQYEKIVLDNVKNKHISGTIYSNSLIKYPEQKCNDIPIDFEQRQKKLLSYAFESSYLWNSLHDDEFGIGTLIDNQVVKMVSNMFGSNNQVAGIVTSGGTESLMTAVRAYRNFGMMEKGHYPNESVIIAPDTVHAAILKAGEAYNVKIVLLKTDQYGCFDLINFRRTVMYYRNEIVAIICSAPFYNIGNIDPVIKMAQIALDYNCGLHVDCCLGGFIINHIHNTNYLNIDGVTSLSVDTHKNGHAPKGSSVLITKKINYSNKYLINYSIYAIPEWSGGVYGTIKNNGSTSSVPGLTALVSMLIIGENGYKKIAERIYTYLEILSLRISEIDDFTVLNDCNNYVNVIAWKMNTKKNYRDGFICSFAHEMKRNGVILNVMKNGIVHFCITDRFTENENAIDEFTDALKISLNVTKIMNDYGSNFLGDASLYGSLETALAPTKSDSFYSFIENLFFGQIGVLEGIRNNFMGSIII